MPVRFRPFFQFAGVAAILLTGFSAALAQRGGPAPEPLAVTITTKDGVELKGTYYPSSAGRDAVPVILLHDYKETRATLDPLARELQNPPPPPEGSNAPPLVSRAVFTIDLRGHGESQTAFDAAGGAVKFDAAQLGVADFENMVLLDMEAVRSFLVDENDRGRLNLNKLCVVGVGMGANVALLWTARDWAAPPLAVRKQGQDVKALGLISPRWNFRGLNVVEAMKFPPLLRQVSVYLAYGADDPAFAKDGKNFEKSFSRFHPAPPADQPGRRDFYVYAPATKLQGTPLLASRQFALVPRIVEFVDARLGSAPYPYIVRKK